MSYIYPISFFLNNFAMTILIVVLSLIKQPLMAADVGIVQGATLALFYAFSANGRNVILNPTSQISLRALLISRLLLLVPLGIIAFYLSVYVAHVAGLLAFALILRRASEWLCELCLSDMELRGLRNPAVKFNVLQLMLLVLVLGWTIGNFPKHEIGICIWALLPLFMVRSSFRDGMATGGKIGKAWRHMVPHLGSTAIIGITVYVFRLLIMQLTGKEMAGDLYAAFAIGGVICSVYASALGPSLVLHEERGGKIYQPILLKASLWIWFIAGALLFIGAGLKQNALGWTHKPDYFWMATGISMIGGVVMVFALRIRLRLLQVYHGKDVYGPDVLSNILIVACLPYVYYLFGKDAMMGLFLFSAIVNFLFYYSAEMTITSQHKLSEVAMDALNKVLPLLLLFPLFFQLTGNIFHDNSFVFDSKGILTQLPIPISVLACYFGILLLGSYRHAYLSLKVIFMTFVVMLTTSMIPTNGELAPQHRKILLLLQFVLPMFALVLGQMYEFSKRNVLIFEKIFLYTTAVIVPVQIVSSVLQGSVVLTPYLYFFSVYQHTQYVSFIFVCCYLLALFSLWKSPRHKKIIIILSFFMGVYAVASASISALLGLIIGVAGFAVYRWRLGTTDKPVIGLLCLVVIGVLFYLPLAPNNGTLAEKFTFLRKDANLTKIQNSVPNMADRLYYWKYYTKEISTDARVFLLGHAEPPDREKFPSAHNYYLDFIYNFGFISMIPILALIGYTLRLISRYRQAILNSASFLGLAVVVLLLVLVENSVKVGLRQPYPGILTYFLWGVLLSRLARLEAPKLEEFPSLQPSAAFDADTIPNAICNISRRNQ